MAEAERIRELEAENAQLKKDMLYAGERIAGQRDILKRHEAKMEAMEKEIARLKAMLFSKDRHGYDCQGPGDVTPGRGFLCDCRWSSAHHGDICPEHGHEGKPIVDSGVAYVQGLESENARLKELVDGRNSKQN